MTQFKELKIQAIRRELNYHVDTLANGAAYGEYSKKNELVLKKDSVEEEEEEKLCEVNMIDVSEELEEECCWMKEIIDFL